MKSPIIDRLWPARIGSVVLLASLFSLLHHPIVLIAAINAEKSSRNDFDPGNVHVLGNHKHLFIDKFLLSSLQGAHLQVNPPQVKDLVLVADKPWERGGLTSYGNVFYDPRIKRYRMYYVPVNFDVEPVFNTCLALSDDGIHWEKPNLGAVEWQQSTANNIVISRQREGTVFVDPTAAPKHRYAYLSSDETDLRLFTSPDGVHFTMQGKISDFRSDSQIASFWDDRLSKFVHYPRLRVQHLSKHEVRGVGRVEVNTVDAKGPWQMDSDSPREAPDGMPLVMSPDKRDPPGVDLYTNAAQKYGDIPNVYLAFPTPYYHYDYPGREYLNEPALAVGGKTNDGVIESQLAVSRDGVRWTRYRTPYIPLLKYEELDLKVNMIYPGVIKRDTTVDQYFSGYTFTHGDTEARRRLKGRELGGIFRVEQRLDGFVSLDFDYEGGVVVTDPFIFRGSELLLNLNTSASGDARVAVLNEDGEELEPFGTENCRILNGNFFSVPVDWGNKKALSFLEGSPIRLKFVMRGTKLYSFQFE